MTTGATSTLHEIELPPRASEIAPMFAKAVAVLFAGAGGACIGIEQALCDAGFKDRYVDLAINHWDTAIGVHELNHPMTQHLRADVREVDPRSVLKGRELGLLWLSPDCTDFSKAKGGKPKRKHIRGLAWVGIKWAQLRRPDVIILENVEEFQDWGPVKQVRRNGSYLWEIGDPDVGKKKGKRITVEGPAEASGQSAAWRSLFEANGWSVAPVAVPVKQHRKRTFKQWKAALEGLGYRVEHQERRAMHDGAPTTRKRLFVIARRDGGEFIWPEPSHGRIAESTGTDRSDEGLPERIRRQRAGDQGSPRTSGAGERPNQRSHRKLIPCRAAAGCVDWSIPMLSMFATRPEAVTWAKVQNVGRPKHLRVGVPQRPLQPKTHKRIAGGFLKWVLDAAQPYVVTLANGGFDDSPSRASGTDSPISTITGVRKHAVVAPTFTAGVGGRAGQSPTTPTDRPMPTVTGKGDRILVAAEVAPLTVPRYGEREGPAPRSASIETPLPTIVGTGNGATLVAVALNKHYTGVIGQAVDQPIGTITATDHHSVMAVSLSNGASDGEGKTGAILRVRGINERDGVTSKQGDVAAGDVEFDAHGAGAQAVQRGHGGSGESETREGGVEGVAPFTLGAGGPVYAGKPKSLDEPLGTVMVENHRAVVAVSLANFHSEKGDESRGQAADEPIRTLDTQNRFAVVAAHTMKYRGDSVGSPLSDPMPTITAGGHTARDAGAAHALGTAVAFLSHMYTSNTCGGQGDPGKPLKTITSGGQHAKVCVVYYTPYYGEGSGKGGHSLAEPMQTVVGKDRFANVSVETTKHWLFTPKGLARARQVATWAIKQLGKKVAKHLLWVRDESGKKFALVTLMVEGALRIVSDIAIRMFAPKELLLAQGFPPDYRVDMTSDGQHVSKADQVKLIGNSVCPPCARRLVFANIVMQGVLGPIPSMTASLRARKGERSSSGSTLDTENYAHARSRALQTMKFGLPGAVESGVVP